MVRFRPEAPNADVAHPVERHLAKVEVASSSLVIRSKKGEGKALNSTENLSAFSFGVIAKW